MPSKTQSTGWFNDFFQGAALELWRRANSSEDTQREVQFLQKALATPMGGKLLDLPCGNGRLSLPMALLGYQVTGVDFSTTFLEEAQSTAKAYKCKTNFINADMRELTYENEFDGAFCMGNSFGYFDRAGTTTFLGTVSKSLKPRARFIIESAMVAECFLVNGSEREWLQRGNMYMLVENDYDCRLSTVESKYVFIENGKEETRCATHWVYTTGELCQMLEEAGFSVEELFSSPDPDEAEPFTLGAERLIVVAEKR